MTPEIMTWGTGIMTAPDVVGQDVLEVGSLDVNGSLRSHVMSLGPKSYCGVDLDSGYLNPVTNAWIPNASVDRVLRAEDLVLAFGLNAFGLVLSTEMLEHARAWQTVVWNMMAVTKPGGLMVVTTRGPGFPYHPYPEDCWRYTVGDFEQIWADWDIEDLRDDPGNPGVFIRARKLADWDSAGEAARLANLTVMAQPKTY